MTVESSQLKLIAAGMAQKLSPTSVPRREGGCSRSIGIVFGCCSDAAVGGLGGLLRDRSSARVGFIAPGSTSRREGAQPARADPRRAARTRSTCSPSASRRASASTAPSPSSPSTWTGPLADEFALTLGEMRIGESRQEALKKLAERVDAPEIAAFIRAIIQADQLGISLGRILRVQAADTRHRRQAAAEERAMKAPIKMLFPTVLVHLPGDVPRHPRAGHPQPREALRLGASHVQCFDENKQVDGQESRAMQARQPRAASAPA